MQGAGKIYWGSDFTGIYDSYVWGATNLAANFPGGLGFTSVNEGSFASTVDESGGILKVTTDTADNDNAAFLAGKFAPRDGKMVLHARFKIADVTTGAIFCGFAETMALDTPVMPAEFATATMTYNPGGMVGFSFDPDGTTDDFRAVMGDGSAAISDSANGIAAGATITNDNYYEVTVILNEDGSAECWLGDNGHAMSVDGSMKSRPIKRFSTGTLLDPTNLFFAVLMVENRSGAANTFEVDYFKGEAGRDWRP